MDDYDPIVKLQGEEDSDVRHDERELMEQIRVLREDRDRAFVFLHQNDEARAVLAKFYDGDLSVCACLGGEPICHCAMSFVRNCLGNATRKE